MTTASISRRRLLYLNKRDKDGHNLLFGNMGPEMIMYVLQKPAYRFPQDYQYFCRLDVDDSVIFVRQKSPFRRIEDVIDAARKKTVNVAVTRLPHPASLGALALARATKAKFNLVPYGGGNPTMVFPSPAVLARLAPAQGAGRRAVRRGQLGTHAK
jgi:tripartite-type tricarboxylate transporter receptor subunit TctC